MVLLDVQCVWTELLLIRKLISIELIGFEVIGVLRVVVGLIGIHRMICSIELIL